MACLGGGGAKPSAPSKDAMIASREFLPVTLKTGANQIQLLDAKGNFMTGVTKDKNKPVPTDPTAKMRLDLGI